MNHMRWSRIFACLADVTPNVLAVISLLMTIPPHSADCERGFSLMSRVKTDWRASLNEETLNLLMRIGLLCPPIGEFDPTHAVNLWLTSSTRARRVGIQPYGPRIQAETGSDESDG